MHFPCKKFLLTYDHLLQSSENYTKKRIACIEKNKAEHSNNDKKTKQNQPDFMVLPRIKNRIIHSMNKALHENRINQIDKMSNSNSIPINLGKDLICKSEKSKIINRISCKTRSVNTKTTL